jgi:hypothetical protein
MTAVDPDYKATLGDDIAIAATFDDAVGTDFDLTGCAVTIRIRAATDGAVVVDNATCSIEDGPHRQVRYIGQPTWPSAGLYHAQFKVAFLDGREIHFPRPGWLLVQVSDPV